MTPGISSSIHKGRNRNALGCRFQGNRLLKKQQNKRMKFQLKNSSVPFCSYFDTYLSLFTKIY